MNKNLKKKTISNMYCIAQFKHLLHRYIEHFKYIFQ
jgi:hypothetical protein